MRGSLLLAPTASAPTPGWRRAGRSFGTPPWGAGV